MNEWIEIDSIEDIAVVGDEILVWDGCECHIDYVEIDCDWGHSYMANGSEPTHWMPLPEAPTL